MSHSAKPFVYQRLPPGHIRLLYKTIDDVGVAGWSLRTTSLDASGSNSPAYDALSYTWGDQSHTFPFVVDGRTLHIHHNLKEALPYLARRQSSLPIWIDALCINQSDEAEKAVQVRRMYAIYRQAARVWVWLGRGVVGTDIVNEAIALLPRFNLVAAEVGRNFLWPYERPTPESKGLPPPSSPVWDVLHDLIASPWYSRLWIVQEAALARAITVLYGDHEVEWETLRQAVENCNELPLRMQGFQKSARLKGFSNHMAVFSVRDIVQDTSKWSSSDWIESFRSIVVTTATSQNCFAPQDRVLGLLGFLNPERIVEIGIQDPTLSTNQLYIRFTHFLLTHGDPAADDVWWKLLHQSWTLDKDPDLPSWCPDYPKVNNALRLVPMQLQDLGSFWTQPHYHASHSFDFPPQRADVCDLLVLRGKVFDEVSRVYPTFIPPRVWTEDDLASAVYEWEQALALDIMGSERIYEEQPADEEGEVPTLVSRENYREVKPQHALFEAYWCTLFAKHRWEGRALRPEDYFAFRRAGKAAADGRSTLITIRETERYVLGRAILCARGIESSMAKLR